MAQVTVTQSASDTGGGNVSLAGVTAGRMLVCVIMVGRFFGSTPAISSVSGGGATWTQRCAGTFNDKGLWIYTGTGTSGGTVTMSVTYTGDADMTFLYELDGNASDFDVKAGPASGTSTSASSGATATLASDEDLAIAACMADFNAVSFTATGGFTEDFDIDTAGADWAGSTSQLQVTSTTGVTGSYTLSTSTEWIATVLTIKPAGGGGSPTGNTLNSKTLRSLTQGRVLI